MVVHRAPAITALSPAVRERGSQGPQHEGTMLLCRLLLARCVFTQTEAAIFCSRNAQRPEQVSQRPPCYGFLSSDDGSVCPEPAPAALVERRCDILVIKWLIPCSPFLHLTICSSPGNVSVAIARLRELSLSISPSFSQPADSHVRMTAQRNARFTGLMVKQRSEESITPATRLGYFRIE